MKNAKILWIDLEMTGLEPEKDRILEVAAIATDWDFNEIATFESAVKVENEILKSRMVGDFWDTFSETRDALKIQNSRAIKNSQEVEADLIKFIEENFAEELSKGEKFFWAEIQFTKIADLFVKSGKNLKKCCIIEC